MFYQDCKLLLKKGFRKKCFSFLDEVISKTKEYLRVHEPTKCNYFKNLLMPLTHQDILLGQVQLTSQLATKTKKMFLYILVESRNQKNVFLYISQQKNCDDLCWYSNVHHKSEEIKKYFFHFGRVKLTEDVQKYLIFFPRSPQDTL